MKAGDLIEMTGRTTRGPAMVMNVGIGVYMGKKTGTVDLTQDLRPGDIIRTIEVICGNAKERWEINADEQGLEIHVHR